MALPFNPYRVQEPGVYALPEEAQRVIAQAEAAKPMLYEAVVGNEHGDEWLVEAINRVASGEIYVACFNGPNAETRAKEYAAWKNGGAGWAPDRAASR